MKKEIIAKLTKSFEESVHIEQGIEFWMARDIQELLEYDKWSNFFNVIEKAKTACQNSSHIVKDHFADVGKMVPIGSGGTREIPDIHAVKICLLSHRTKWRPQKRIHRFCSKLLCPSNEKARAARVFHNIKKSKTQVNRRSSRNRKTKGLTA